MPPRTGPRGDRRLPVGVQAGSVAVKIAPNGDAGSCAPSLSVKDSPRSFQ